MNFSSPHTPSSGPPVVGRDSVLSAPLNVERAQVESVALPGLLEQVVLHLGAHGVVQGLGDLKKRKKWRERESN